MVSNTDGQCYFYLHHVWIINPLYMDVKVSICLLQMLIVPLKTQEKSKKKKTTTNMTYQSWIIKSFCKLK